MKLISVLLLLVIICACESNSTEEERDKLHREVMAVHDEVMPEMSTIFRQIRGIDSLLSGPDSVAHVDKRERLYELRIDLERAEEAMMSWMAEFQQTDKMAPEEAVIYLKNEMEKVTDVKRMMLSAISEAENYRKTLTESRDATN